MQQRLKLQQQQALMQQALLQQQQMYHPGMIAAAMSQVNLFPNFELALSRSFSLLVFPIPSFAFNAKLLYQFGGLNWSPLRVNYGCVVFHFRKIRNKGI